MILEINECYYYLSEKDSQEHDEKKAVGYEKTANGIFVCGRGKITEYKWIKSMVTNNE